MSHEIRNLIGLILCGIPVIMFLPWLYRELRDFTQPDRIMEFKDPKARKDLDAEIEKRTGLNDNTINLEDLWVGMI